VRAAANLNTQSIHTMTALRQLENGFLGFRHIAKLDHFELTSRSLNAELDE